MAALFVNTMAGRMYRFSLFMTALTMFGVVQSENQCLGSNCFCTEYPVWIMCKDGHPDYIPELVKRVAVGIEIDGDGAQDVTRFELSEYPSVENIEVKIADDSVCQWISENADSYPNVKISGPPYCREYENDGEMTITEGEIAGWVVSTILVIVLVLLRKKIK